MACSVITYIYMFINPPQYWYHTGIENRSISVSIDYVLNRKRIALVAKVLVNLVLKFYWIRFSLVREVIIDNVNAHSFGMSTITVVPLNGARIYILWASYRYLHHWTCLWIMKQTKNDQIITMSPFIFFHGIVSLYAVSQQQSDEGFSWLLKWLKTIAACEYCSIWAGLILTAKLTDMG